MVKQLELWGGIECSVTRIHDHFNDQLERSGHARRPGDLDLIANLGLKTIRYPVLWERTVGYRGTECNWQWADKQLSSLKQRGIDPIVGLLHHGSGPHWTSLLDPDFPQRFASYAGEVAKRYPWVRRYTPINEPLTTARFSGLYGHWFPHYRDDFAFYTMVFNQCKAIVLAMDAIRAVNPGAELVQTEDLGSVLSTGPLRYQARFENHRRWLATDLLCGLFNQGHPLIKYITRAGIDDNVIEAWCGPVRGPDILGFNHYITSNRFLDHRHQAYPSHVRGSNGRHCYADVEAIRVGLDDLITLDMLLVEAWCRYKRPLALTEVHLTCTPTEQCRWMVKCWDAAMLAAKQADVRAVTVWALFGLYDWDSLTVERNNRYEPGVFSVEEGSPRPTALANLIRTIASTGTYDDETAPEELGWWERPERVLYPAASDSGR